MKMIIKSALKYVKVIINKRYVLEVRTHGSVFKTLIALLRDPGLISYIHSLPNNCV